MIKFILFIFLLIIFAILFLGSSIFSLLFGRPKPKANQNPYTRAKSQTQQNQSKTQKTNSNSSSKKIIDRDEGEYVDFEEIKE